MSPKRYNKGLAYCAVAGAVAAGFILLANSISASEKPSLEDYQVAALLSENVDQSQSTLPEEIFRSVMPDTVHRIGETPDVEYWVALDREERICLIVVSGGENWVSGTSRSDLKSFLSEGTGVRLYGPDSLLESYLVPDDVGTPLRAQRVNENIVLIDPTLTKQARVGVNERSQSGFGLRVFDAPIDLEAGGRDG